MTKNRRNLYSGPCTACGDEVRAHAGTCTREANRWAVRHDRCPRDIEAERAAQPPVTPWAERSLDERIEITSKRNPYLAGKLALVESSTSYEQALARISASSQGMTMDYMTEFANERSANELARERAVEKFEMAEVAR